MPSHAPNVVSGPPRAWDSAARDIDSGFYYISDREAGLIARENRIQLPAHGYEARVELPYDGRLAWLSRTPARWRPGQNYPLTHGPKRGWVWAISGIR